MAEEGKQGGDKINVWIKLDMGGDKGICFNISRDTLVSELIDMIKTNQGPQVASVHLIRGAKPMRVKNNNGGSMKLSDYNCYDNCTIISSLRLIGGAAAPEAKSNPADDPEGKSFTIFDSDEVVKYGGKLAISGRADNGSQTYINCHYNMNNGCKESSCPKATCGCNCVFCADCMRTHLDYTIKLGGGVKLRCASSGHNNGDINPVLQYAIAGLTAEEKSAKDIVLSQNYFKRADSDMHLCKNGKCKKIIFREQGNTSLKVQCTSCHKYVCWSCTNEHKEVGVWCGNDDCDPVAVVNQLIELGVMKEISATHGKFQCWDSRFCPNKACSAVNGHDSGCQRVICGVCNTEYCHLCLGLWNKEGGCKYGGNCQPKPKENITKADLPK